MKNQYSLGIIAIGLQREALGTRSLPGSWRNWGSGRFGFGRNCMFLCRLVGLRVRASAAVLPCRLGTSPDSMSSWSCTFWRTGARKNLLVSPEQRPTVPRCSTLIGPGLLPSKPKGTHVRARTHTHTLHRKQGRNAAVRRATVTSNGMEWHGMVFVSLQPFISTRHSTQHRRPGKPSGPK